MKLKELDPRWYGTRTSDELVGMSFLCPCCREIRLGVRFSHLAPHILQPDGAIHIPTQVWKISGDEPSFSEDLHHGFDNVSLTPSVDASSFGHWHGFITNGEVR
jgi:hypothetical protein